MHIAGAARHRRLASAAPPSTRRGRSDGVAESGIEARRRRYEGGGLWRRGTNPAWRGPLSCRPRHTGPRRRAFVPRRSLLAVRTGAGRWGDAYLPGALAGHGVAPHPLQLAYQRWAIEHSTRNSRTNWARSLRRAQPAWLATARRVDGDRLQLSSARRGRRGQPSSPCRVCAR